MSNKCSTPVPSMEGKTHQWNQLDQLVLTPIETCDMVFCEVLTPTGYSSPHLALHDQCSADGVVCMLNFDEDSTSSWTSDSNNNCSPDSQDQSFYSLDETTDTESDSLSDVYSEQVKSTIARCISAFMWNEDDGKTDYTVSEENHPTASKFPAISEVVTSTRYDDHHLSLHDQSSTASVVCKLNFEDSTSWTSDNNSDSDEQSVTDSSYSLDETPLSETSMSDVYNQQLASTISSCVSVFMWNKDDTTDCTSTEGHSLTASPASEKYQKNKARSSLSRVPDIQPIIIEQITHGTNRNC